MDYEIIIIAILIIVIFSTLKKLDKARSTIHKIDKKIKAAWIPKNNKEYKNSSEDILIKEIKSIIQRHIDSSNV